MNERLASIARALAEAADAPPDRDGRRRLPMIQPRDAAELVGVMNAQLDQAIAHRSEDATAKGIVIACKRGCNACCHNPVVIGEHEAIAVAVWLAEPAHQAVRARFDAAYPAWRATLGALVESTITDLERAGTTAAANAYRARHALCPFNHEGDCTIYPVRPALCRKALALDTSAACEDVGGKVTYFEHAETEETYAAQKPARTLLHATLRPDRAGELLPKAVKRRLDAPGAGRNDPCVCGSGAKLKKCCGA